MEGKRAGRIYDIRLIGRLLRYAAPYRLKIVLILILTLALTTIDLSAPYLGKIAIDRYILSYWYIIENVKDQEFLISELKKVNAIRVGKDSFSVNGADLKRLSPETIRYLKERGMLLEERFFRIPKGYISYFRAEELLHLRDGSYLVRDRSLSRLKNFQILSIREKDIRGILYLSAILFSMIILYWIFSFFQYLLLERTAQGMMLQIRCDLFSKILERDIPFFDRNPIGRLVNRVTNDIENLNEMFKSVFITIFQDLFILFGIMAIMFYLDISLAIKSLIIIPIIFSIALLFSTRARDAFRELRERISALNIFLQERIKGILIIKLFNQYGFQKERFRGINHRTYLAGMKQVKVFAMFMPLMELISSLAIALIIWYGGGEVLRKDITLGTLVAFLSYIQMFFRPVRDISEKYNIMQAAMASWERILDYMEYKRKGSALIKKEYHPPGNRGIRFENVSFSYLKGREVLHNVNFEVNPGERIAIVGATGSGKSTIINLLCRFYRPDKGKIYLDGVDIHKISDKTFSSLISLVPQDIFLFKGSILENIIFDRKIADPRSFRRVLEGSNITEIISRYPEGIEKDVGEGGMNLSSGERQLVCLARAFANESKILILDEATSHIDPETEVLIQDAIRRIVRDKTAIIVAHRLSTVKEADRILVISSGRVGEQGDHNELIRKGKIYPLLMGILKQNG